MDTFNIQKEGLRDAKIATLLILIAGCVLFLSTYILQLPFPKYVVALLLLLALPSITFVGYLLVLYVQKYVPSLVHMAKFSIIGFLSSSLDLAILSTGILLTGMSSGLPFALMKTLSYLIVLHNSYFLNRSWTFNSHQGNVPIQFGKFFASNMVGLCINVAVASFVVDIVGPPEGVSGILWANIAAVIATFIAMVWNFLSYKYLVFKK